MHQSQLEIIIKLLLSSMLLALFYGYSHHYFSVSPFVLVKVSSILLLAIIIKFYKIEDITFATLLFTAVIFHCIGDFTIEISGSLLNSVPFFFIGHFIYCLILMRDIKINFYNKKLIIPLWKYSLIIFILIAAFFVGKFMLNGIKIKFPDDIMLYYGVAMYVVVLVFLSTFSVLHPACLRFLFLGVLLYILSDSLIAYHEFIQPQMVLRRLLSWPLYYSAQVLIIFTLLHYHLNTLKNTQQFEFIK